ncbi:hypothetical protein NECAME_01926 [Necator americanus]|uniref:NFACT RNA-binding domain-containing protein n=1 Tax=Necator americanus TaxID=51031 RepID=W2TNC9_NECAM|nr:hypothetical protein NECAME_01926 [Necator americanus]ETN82641.1 hypothetical protein NECAME_01926 [Necator americanus]
MPLKKALSVPGLLSGALIEHSLLVNSISPDMQVCAVEEKDFCAVQVVKALNEAKRIVFEIRDGKTAGYLFYTTQTRIDGSEVDVFLQQAVVKVEKEAMKRLDNVRKDQHRRILELEYSREEKMLMADLIIHNQTLVDSAIQVICSALALKTSWENVEKMHMDAVSKGDSVARAIVKLDLKNNMIIMRLSEELEGIPSKDVPISIDTTAYGNACKLYHGMKAAAEKALRTEAAAQKAIKNAEDKANATIKKVNVDVNSIKTRKQMWFEKFIWFVSSEKYMIIAGRDAAQNELLVKRYLRTQDIYVHADAYGAASVIIRNKEGGGEIPPKTLTEAAQMATCCTKAWGSHISSSAWWVYAWQVSKIAKSGEYLTKGSFVIRGMKNFLPICPLVLGFGILFRVDEISAQKHQEKMQKQFSNACPSEIVEEGEECNRGSDENALPVANHVAKTNELLEEYEYPDIKLEVATVRLQNEDDSLDDYSVINFTPKGRTRKQNVPTTELETKEYLEKKAEEERKHGSHGRIQLQAAILKKGGKREKHKMEKIRRKYRDQDEEEREMRMNLLGSRGKQKSAEENPFTSAKYTTGATKLKERTQENKQSDEKLETQVEKETPLVENRALGEQGNREKPVEEESALEKDDIPKDVLSLAVELDKTELNRSLEESTVKKDSDAEPSNMITLQGNIQEELISVGTSTGGCKSDVEANLDTTVNKEPFEDKETSPSGRVLDVVQNVNEDYEEEFKESMGDEGTETLITQLISNPDSDDIIIYAVPMVGPYQVFQNFKYKVKLTPGSTKKGKAGKAAIDLFLRMKNTEVREREFIRAIASDDKTWANIPTGCRVSAPHLHAKK